MAVANPITAQQLANQIAALNAKISALSSAVASSGGGSGLNTSFPTSLIIPFDYVVPITLAANATASTILQMASDSTFELETLLCWTSLDVPTQYYNNNFQVVIQDQSTGRLFSNQPVQQACMVRNSFQYAQSNKYPILWPAQGIVNLTFTNLNVNNQITIQFTFHGYKIYQTSA